MPPRPNEVFFSYSVVSDESDEGALRDLHLQLEREVRQQLGEREFKIFLDKRDVKFGERFQGKLEDTLAGVLVLVPVLTPLFFNSLWCRREVELFMKREQQLGRNDLILPIYYVSCPQLAKTPAGDHVATTMSERQWLDWRDFRYGGADTPEARRKLAAFAERIRDVILEVREAGNTPHPGEPAASGPAPSPPGRAASLQAIEQLQKLLLSMFSVDELRRLFSFHFEPSLAAAINFHDNPSNVTFEVVTALQRSGLIDRAFFELLAAQRPQRLREIDAVRQLWGA